MTRTFIYSFAPPSLDPSPGATIALDVSEIEDAGIREVLQTPGAAPETITYILRPFRSEGALPGARADV